MNASREQRYFFKEKYYYWENRSRIANFLMNGRMGKGRMRFFFYFLFSRPAITGIDDRIPPPLKGGRENVCWVAAVDN